MIGKILKGIGGFYYVRPLNSKNVIECKARGKFRNKAIKPFVGHDVEFEITDALNNKGSIDKILPEKNSFIRPPVANIDSLVIVVSCDNPKPDFSFVDKMLTICKYKNVDAYLCMTKTDLVSEDEISLFSSVYERIGIPVIKTSSENKSGINEIKNILPKKVTAFSGFSGVGKSTLLNNVLGMDFMQTGEVSKKIGRGRHTTRHVELIEYMDGFVVDTPGFGSLELPDIDESTLKDFFIEFHEYEQNCKFPNCMHLSTKFCGVYDAYKEGLISQSRLDNYREFYKILKDKKEW